MADPFDAFPDPGSDFGDDDWDSAFPDPGSNFADSWGDYASDLGKSAVTGLVGGSVGLAERVLTGGAAAADAVGLPLGVRDFLLEQGLTAKNVKEQVYDAGVDRDKYGALSVPALVQGGIGGVAEYSPALLNPLLGSSAVGAGGAAKKYYDLPIQAEDGVVPTQLERLGSGAAIGGLEALGAGLPMRFINKPLTGAKDFLGRTAKVAGIGAATNVPIALTDMATNEAFAGQDFTPEQYVEASKEAALASAAGAPLFTALGAFGARGQRPNLANFDSWAPPFEPPPAPPPAEPLGLPPPQGKLPPPPDRVYGPDAGYVMRDVPAVTELSDSYLPSRLNNEKTSIPEPVQLKVTSRGVEEDGVITVKPKPKPKGLELETTSARTPDQLAEAAAIRAEMEPGVLWSRGIDEGTRTPVYNERRVAPDLLGRATRTDGRPVNALDANERGIVQGIMDDAAPVYDSYRIGGPNDYMGLLSPQRAPVIDTRLLNRPEALDRTRAFLTKPDVPGLTQTGLTKPELLERTKTLLAKPDALVEDGQGTVKVRVSEPVSEQPVIQAAAKQAAETGQPVVIEGTVDAPVRIIADEDAAARVEAWAGEPGRGFTDVNRQLVDEVSRPPVGESQWVDTSTIVARPEEMQFRRGDDVDSTTGASEDRKIKKDDLWDSVKGGRLLVFQPKDRAAWGLKPGQEYVVVNGHNRFAGANEKNISRVQVEVIRETDGWSAADAVAYGAELNISQGDAKPTDIVRFYRNYAQSRGSEAATERGRAIGAKGQKHLAVALKAQAPLYSNFVAGKVDIDQAYAIVREAQENEVYQEVGLRLVLENPKADGFEISSKIQAEKFVDDEIRGDQGSMPWDDPIPPEIRKQAMHNVTTRLRKEITTDIQSLASAKQAKKAEQRGIVVKDEAGALLDLKGLERERRALRSWQDVPEIRTKVLKEYNEEAARLNKEAKRNEQGKLNLGASARAREGGFIVFPESLQRLAERTGDNLREMWGSIKGFSEGEPLPDIESFLKGEGFRPLVFQKFQGKFREQAIFPRTLAEKEPDFVRMYKTVTSVERMKTTMSRVAFREAKDYFEVSRADRKPVDQLLIKMRKRAAEAKKQGAVINELSDSTLASQGFSPEQIKAYRSARNFFDWSLDQVEWVLAKYTEQLPEADRQVALEDVAAWVKEKRESFYVPFLRERGEWSVAVENKAGDTEFFSVYKTQAEAKRAAKKLGPSAAVKQLNNFVPEEIRGLPLDIQIAVGSALEGEPQQPSLRGFRARLAKARLVEGFNENLAPGIADYALSLSKWASLSYGAPEAFGAISSIPDSKPRLRQYANRYWQDYKRGADPYATAVMRFVNMYTLAGVPASGVANLSQTATTTLPLLTSRKWGGNMKDAPGMLIRAAKDAADHAILGAEKFAARSAANAEKAAALRIGLERGDLDAQAMGELASFRSGNEAKLSAYDAIMKTFTVTESANRRVAFLAAFELAKKQGQTFGDAVSFAEEFVKSTQFDMTDANRPQGLRHPWMRVLTQYKPFTGHMLRFIRNAFKARDYNTLALTFGAQAMFAGARGLPFAAVTIGLVDSIFGTNTNEEIRKFVDNERVANSVLYGIPAGEFDVNMSTATGLGDFIQPIDQGVGRSALNALVGPIGQLALVKPQKAKEALDKDAPWNAAANLAPRFLRGPIKAAEYSLTGQLSDVYGDPLIAKTSDSLRDAYTTATLLAGFPTGKYINEYEKRSGEAKLMERARDNDDINLRFYKAWKAKDRERMDAIKQEARDSRKGPRAERKQIDLNRVMEYAYDRDKRTLRRTPMEIRQEMRELQRLYSSGE